MATGLPACRRTVAAQAAIARGARMKYTPKLSFHYDEGPERAARLLQEGELEAHLLCDLPQRVAGALGLEHMFDR